MTDGPASSHSSAIMRAMVLFALGSSLAVAAACSSSSNQGDPCFCDNPDGSAYNPDSGNSYFVDAGATPFSYTPTTLENDLCLPNALPTDGGLVDCHVVLFFPSTLTCASVGLTQAALSDGTYLTDDYAANGVPLPSGSFCALDQLPSDACLADAGAGWCYAPGGCETDAGCEQALCTSSGFDAGASPIYEWLVCPKK